MALHVTAPSSTLHIPSLSPPVGPSASTGPAIWALAAAAVGAAGTAATTAGCEEVGALLPECSPAAPCQ